MTRLSAIFALFFLSGTRLYQIEIEVEKNAFSSRWKLELTADAEKITRISPPGPSVIHSPTQSLLLLPEEKFALELPRSIPLPPYFPILRKILVGLPIEEKHPQKPFPPLEWEVIRDNQGNPKEILLRMGRARRKVRIHILSYKQEEKEDWEISEWWEGYTYLHFREFRGLPLREFLRKNRFPTQFLWLKAERAQIVYAEEKKWVMRVFYRGWRRWVALEISTGFPQKFSPPVFPRIPRKPLFFQKGTLHISLWGNLEKNLMKKRLEVIFPERDSSPSLILPVPTE
ncbi:MAG: hypothetical protein V2G33_04520 [bacterium JZ-2024 1]